MTKIAYIADLHIANHKRFAGKYESGLNERCRLILGALERALTEARDLGAEAVVVLGDTFDDVRPSPQILAATARVFGRAGLPTYMLVGNHDQVSGSPGDHALGPLEVSECEIFVIEKPTTVKIGKTALMLVPFRAGAASEWLPDVVEELSPVPTNDNVLCVHMGISDNTTPPYLRSAPDSISATQLGGIMQVHGIKRAFAGNWHFHRTWEIGEQRITQVGALVPTGFDNPGVGYGSVIVADANEQWRSTVRGPRFFAFDFEDGTLADVCDLHDVGFSLFVQARVQPAYIAQAKAEIAEKVKAGVLAGGEAIPNKQVTKLVARSAAAAARSADTVDQAVAQYVEHMQMPDGVKRADVLTEVKSYLAKIA